MPQWSALALQGWKDGFVADVAEMQTESNTKACSMKKSREPDSDLHTMFRDIRAHLSLPLLREESNGLFYEDYSLVWRLSTSFETVPSLQVLWSCQPTKSCRAFETAGNSRTR